jgi:hypothetical protein
MQKGAVELTLTLLDNKLLTYDGQTRTEQELESVAAVVAHVQRVIELRQKQGFRVTGERKDDAIVMPPEPVREAIVAASGAEKPDRPEKPPDKSKAPAPKT